jgi:hypothetical protein
MNYFYLSLGIFLFFFTASDIVKTTISSMGGGLVTKFLSRSIWNLYLLLSGRNGKSKALEYAGLTILLSILLFWIMGLWLSFYFVLISDPASVQSSNTLVNATSLEKFYFAGYTLSTLGNGDLKPSADLWRVLTNVAAFSGLAFITTSVTYFVPVLSAVNLQNKLSLYINGMGKTPLEIIENSWNGKDFSSFFSNAPDLSMMLIQHTLNHHTYPVIHYFHNTNQQLAIILSLVKLNEVFHIFKFMIPQEAGVDRLKMSMLGTALSTYLDVALSMYEQRSSLKERPFAPNLQELALKGIPVKNEPLSNYKFDDDLEEQRIKAAKLIESAGWAWTDVYYF